MKKEEMSVNPVTLSFRGEQQCLERGFLDSYTKKYIRQVRIALYLALAVIAIFGAFDLMHVPTKYYALWFVRYGILCPLFILVIFISYYPFFARDMHYVLACLEFVTGACLISLMAYVGHSSLDYVSPGNLMLVFAFGYLICRMRFIYATVAGLLLLAVYNIMLLQVFGSMEKIFFTYNLYLCLFSLVGMFACYYMEYYERRDFYLMALLKDEQKKVKRAKENLMKEVRNRTRELRFRQNDLLEAQRIGHICNWSHDLITEELCWSEEFFRIAGLKSQKPTMELFYSLLNDEDVKRLKSIFAEASKDEGEKEIDLKLVRPDGEIRYLNTRWVSVYDDTGKEIKRFGTNHDITKQKIAEERLENARKMEALGFMAGSVAHDLNNILTGLVGYPELLMMEMDKDNQFLPTVKIIHKSGKRAAAVVSDLLTVARNVAMVKEPANLNHIIMEYFHSPEREKLGSGFPDVTISTRLDSNIHNISCGKIQVMKCLMNLVINGVEAIKEKGAVVISTRNLYVKTPFPDSSKMQAGEHVVLSVSDTGCGLSEEDRQHIFEPYYTKKVVGRSGTGLGLAIVRNIIEAHEGGIKVDSDEHGTLFDLYFPATHESIVTDDKAQPAVSFQGNKERILVIDDDRVQLDIARQMLNIMGYSVEVVNSGEKAIDYLKENSVDLLILDMLMEPGINGRETYEQIIRIHPGQKAIIVSGYSKTEDVEYIQKLGAGSYMNKPYTLKKLAQAILNTLNPPDPNNTNHSSF